MWSRSKDPEPTDLRGEIRKCWKDRSDQQFKTFCLNWRRFMSADLAQFTRNAALVDKVCESSHAEYRDEFSEPYDGEFDYALYFRAIAYSHFSHTMKDRGLMTLLHVSDASTPLGPCSSDSDVSHEICVIVFASLLSLDDGCAGYLLDVCFELADASGRNACFAKLKTRLGQLR